MAPNWKDQAQAIATQFEGMTNKNFTYAVYEQTRVDLIQAIHKNLTDSDKKFLLSFKNLEADWSIYNIEHFSNIQWKLQNLRKLKLNNPDKHADQLVLLQQVLYAR